MAERRKKKTNAASIPKEYRESYERFRREFSAADLQRYTVDEKGVPLSEVVADMERIQSGTATKKERG